MGIFEFKNTHGFNFYDMKFKRTKNIYWTPHNHQDFHEIILFLNGNVEFIVEGNHYPIEPYDIIFTRRSEIHNIHQHSNYSYQALVFEIFNDFFEKNNCQKYINVFTNRPLGANNLIPAKFVREYGIDALFESTARYLDDESDEAIAASAKAVELMYLMNLINQKMNKSGEYTQMILNSSTDYSRLIRDVIIYINKHLTEELNLNKISEMFYISKSHLCHSFKTHTGFSVNRYITAKRLNLVHDLVDEGHSWLDASVEAGFGNYSNFYKTFKNTYGRAPSKK